MVTSRCAKGFCLTRARKPIFLLNKSTLCSARPAPATRQVAAPRRLRTRTEGGSDADWTGTNSTNWFDAGNWSAGVPESTTFTDIGDSQAGTVVVDGAAASSLNLCVGRIFDATQTIQNGGSVTNTSSAFIGRTANATINVTGAGSVWNDSGWTKLGA